MTLAIVRMMIAKTVARVTATMTIPTIISLIIIKTKNVEKPLMLLTRTMITMIMKTVRMMIILRKRAAFIVKRLFPMINSSKP